MIRWRRLSRGTVALRDEPGRRRRSSLRKRWFLSFRNGKNMTGSLAKAKAGAGSAWEEIRERTEFQTMIIILLCCHLGEENPEF